MRHGRDEAPPTRRAGEVERRAANRESKRPLERVLALQRSAGNRAVTALLARAPRTAVPTGDKGTEASGPRATLTGIGTIPLLSVSLGAVRRREVVLTSRLGPHSPKLSKATVHGTEMDVEIVIPHGESAIRLRLKGAIVSSYNFSGAEDRPIETWTLDFSAIEHTVDRVPGGPDGGRDDARGLERG